MSVSFLEPISISKECVSIVRRLHSPTLLRKKMKIKQAYLFESVCTVCISMFPALISEKFKNTIHIIFISHAYHIHVAYKTAGLSDCRTVKVSDYRSAPHLFTAHFATKHESNMNYLNVGLTVSSLERNPNTLWLLHTV